MSSGPSCHKPVSCAACGPPFISVWHGLWSGGEGMVQPLDHQMAFLLIWASLCRVLFLVTVSSYGFSLFMRNYMYVRTCPKASAVQSQEPLSALWLCKWEVCEHCIKTMCSRTPFTWEFFSIHSCLRYCLAFWVLGLTIICGWLLCHCKVTQNGSMALRNENGFPCCLCVGNWNLDLFQ